MDKKLFDYIKELSKRDKKTLSQKALKVSEECGELAKIILPYDNAHGTTHRFIEKERILEESVDVILTAISMAYELGYSHDDIEEMMWEKSKKWQGIQAKEEKVEYPIPYEIHITVDTKHVYEHLAEDYKYFDTKSFKSDCEDIGVKPIVIELEKKSDIIMHDVMTSSCIITDNAGAYSECNRISKELTQRGYKVIRKKIETVPYHPAAPSMLSDKMPKNCYFEAHIGCVISAEEKEQLQMIATCHGAHLSKNFFKKIEGGKFVNMITHRSYSGNYDLFLKELEELKKDLTNHNFQFEKVITEFSIYDTNVSHDFLWLEKNN